jgi:hypothetical protein
MLLIYAAVIAFFVAFAWAVEPQPQRAGAKGPAIAGPGAAVDDDEAVPARDGQAPPGPRGLRDRQAEEPSPILVFGFLAMMVMFYALMFIMLLLFFIWSIWLQARTFYVLPLIAHRNAGVFDAIGTSWRASRERFWELLGLTVVCMVLNVLGASLLYVGLLATTPLMLLIVESAYRERFEPESRIRLDESDDV